jgi:hypothetical protein
MKWVCHENLFVGHIRSSQRRGHVNSTVLLQELEGFAK